MARYGVYQNISTISYAPGVKDTTDLEAATKTITATSEGAAADYTSGALTLPIPTDTRLAIVQIASRLAVTIDSMTAGTLYCRVYVDEKVAGKLLFDTSWAAPAAAKLSAVNLTSGAVWTLLKDGAAHTFLFFFWVDADNAVLSVVELWEGVGDTGAGYLNTVLSLAHKGLIAVESIAVRVGTGGISHIICMFNTGARDGSIAADGAIQRVPSAVVSNPIVMLFDSVGTDLVYISTIRLTLFSVS